MFGQFSTNFSLDNNTYTSGYSGQMNSQNFSNMEQPTQPDYQNQVGGSNFFNGMQSYSSGGGFKGMGQQNNESFIKSDSILDQNAFSMHKGSQDEIAIADSNRNSLNQNSLADQGSSVYTSYQDLPNYDQNVDLDQVAEQIKALFEDKTHWKSKFDAIDNLRILNKYHFQKMNEIINAFWPYISDSFESQKTFIVKNILMFSAEAFMNAQEVRLKDEVVLALVPNILSKSVSEKSILKKEAENALCNLISNCCYDSSVIILSKCCFEKNPAVCEIALYVLGKMINNIGDSLPMLRPESLQIFMMTLGKIMDSAKKGNMKKWATEVCLGLLQRFGRENYEELVMNTVANENLELAKYLAKAIEDKKEVKNKGPGLQEFVQEKRKTLRITPFNIGENVQSNNGQNMFRQPLMSNDQILNQQNFNEGNNMMNMQNSYVNKLFDW